MRELLPFGKKNNFFAMNSDIATVNSDIEIFIRVKFRPSSTDSLVIRLSYFTPPPRLTFFVLPI